MQQLNILSLFNHCVSLALFFLNRNHEFLIQLRRNIQQRGIQLLRVVAIECFIYAPRFILNGVKKIVRLYLLVN